jgi:hypothetical protein
VWFTACQVTWQVMVLATTASCHFISLISVTSKTDVFSACLVCHSNLLSTLDPFSYSFFRLDNYINFVIKWLYQSFQNLNIYNYLTPWTQILSEPFGHSLTPDDINFVTISRNKIAVVDLLPVVKLLKVVSLEFVLKPLFISSTYYFHQNPPSRPPNHLSRPPSPPSLAT